MVGGETGRQVALSGHRIAISGKLQETRRLFRSVPGARHLRLWRVPRDRARSLGAPGQVVSDPQGARAAAAVLEVWEEGSGGSGSYEAPAARRAEESALTKTPPKGGALVTLSSLQSVRVRPTAVVTFDRVVFYKPVVLTSAIEVATRVDSDLARVSADHQIAWQLHSG